MCGPHELIVEFLYCGWVQILLNLYQPAPEKKRTLRRSGTTRVRVLLSPPRQGRGGLSGRTLEARLTARCGVWRRAPGAHVFGGGTSTPPPVDAEEALLCPQGYSVVCCVCTVQLKKRGLSAAL